jgi:hypothetical protein
MVKPNDLKDKTVDRPLDDEKVKEQVKNIKEDKTESNEQKDKE